MSLLDFLASQTPFLVGLILGFVLGAALMSAALRLLEIRIETRHRPLPPPAPDRRAHRPYPGSRPPASYPKPPAPPNPPPAPGAHTPRARR